MAHEKEDRRTNRDDRFLVDRGASPLFLFYLSVLFLFLCFVFAVMACVRCASYCWCRVVAVSLLVTRCSRWCGGHFLSVVCGYRASNRNSHMEVDELRECSGANARSKSEGMDPGGRGGMNRWVYGSDSCQIGRRGGGGGQKRAKRMCTIMRRVFLFSGRPRLFCFSERFYCSGPE